MDTIKTAVVVALLLAVLYGVYIVLNKETVGPPLDVAELSEDDDFLAPPDIDAGFEGERYASARTPRTVQQFEGDVVRNPRTKDVPHDNAPDDADRWATEESESNYIKPPRKPPVDTFDTSRYSELPGDADAMDDLEYDVDDAGDTEDLSADEEVAEASYEPAELPSEKSSYYGTSRYQDPPPTVPGDKGTATKAPTRFSRLKRDAESHLEARRYRAALTTLSSAYGDPALTPEEHDELLRMLDPLAGKVIYSREHLLEPSYEVRSNETLMEIGERYQVPWQLLQNINGIQNPRVMIPGTELKVVRGPFRAEVSLDESEMTLFLDQMYAGRFPITIGNEPAPETGDFAIAAKERGRTYYGDDGREYSADSPENPYGSVWLDLGEDNLSIHGSPQQEAGADVGCIGLSPRDAQDVYGILSVGSRVTIIR
jgi:LysM repeat protein